VLSGGAINTGRGSLKTTRHKRTTHKRTKHTHCVLIHFWLLFIPLKVGVQRERETYRHKSKVTFPAKIKERPNIRFSYQQGIIRMINLLLFPQMHLIHDKGSM